MEERQLAWGYTNIYWSHLNCVWRGYNQIILRFHPQNIFKDKGSNRRTELGKPINQLLLDRITNLEIPKSSPDFLRSASGVGGWINVCLAFLWKFNWNKCVYIIILTKQSFESFWRAAHSKCHLPGVWFKHPTQRNLNQLMRMLQPVQMSRRRWMGIGNALESSQNLNLWCPDVNGENYN